MVGKKALERVAMGEPAGDHLCASGVLHDLGIGVAHVENGENPRILSVLTSMLDKALIDKNDTNKELADGKNRNHTAKFTNWAKISRTKRQSGDDVQMFNCKQKLSVFNGIRAPSIGIESYLLRIYKYAKCSPCCFVLGYAYICRLVSACVVDNLLISTQLVRSSPITSLNIHRLLITSIMLAAKFMDDSHYNNAYFAKIGGVSTVEINGMEMAFLKLISYRLHLNPDYFERLCAQILQEVAIQTTFVRLPTPLHLQCGFDEEEDGEIAPKCTKNSGSRISSTSGAIVAKRVFLALF